MRVSRLLLVAILVSGAVLAPRFQGKSAARGCGDPLRCAAARLPAPITIAGLAGRPVTYRIGRDGRARRIANPQSPVPPDASWFPATGTWYRIQHEHLIVGRGRRTLWRSHGRIAANQIGVVAAGADEVAFQHDHKLYLARFGHAERAIAYRELPLGWTAGGLFSYRYQGRQLVLRSDSGALTKVIARRPLGSDYSVDDGTLYFIAGGAVMSASGTRVVQLGSLTRLGMSANTWLQSLGRLVELQGNDRLVVVRADGSVFASTRLPITHDQAETISSSLVVAPNLRAVAFTVADDRAANPPAKRPYGTETVYLLRPGAAAPIPIHRGRVQFAVCERGASLEWHGHWLLYTNTEGSLAAIDATAPTHTIELENLVRSLPGTRHGFTAAWSGPLTSDG